MISALVLGLLFLSAFSLMMFTRKRHALHAPAAIEDLQAFSQLASAAIREAGADGRRLNGTKALLGLAELRKIAANSRCLMEKAGQYKERMMTWSDVAHGLAAEQGISPDTVSYITNMHRSLLLNNSSSTKKMLLSAMEIILGKFLPHRHYYYTYEVAAEYSFRSDVVESMADELDKPSASLLRLHLS